MKDNHDEVFDLFDDDGFDFEEDEVYTDEFEEDELVEEEFDEEEYDEEYDEESDDEYDDYEDEEEVEDEDDELFTGKSAKKPKARKSNGGGSKKGLLIALVAILAIVMVVLAVLFFGKDKDQPGKTDENQTTTSAEEQTTEEPTTAAPPTLAADNKAEVKPLMEAYYSAIKNANLTELGKVIDSTANMSLQKMEKRAEYVEDFQNITCYTVDGKDTNTYLVFVAFDYKFVNIDTLCPAMDYFYLKTREDGSLYVSTEFTQEEKDFIAVEKNKEEVLNTIQVVNDRFNVALASDQKLNNFYKLLLSGEDVTAPAPDETTAAPSDETTVATDETTAAPTTEAVAGQDTAVIRDGGGTLRSSAKVDNSEETNNVLGSYDGGEKVIVFGSTNDGSYDWYKVRVEKDGKEGYIREDCLTFN